MTGVSAAGTTLIRARVGAKQLLDGGRPIVVTIPERVTIDPADLASALDTAA